MGRSSYKRLGDYIQPVDIRNKDNAVDKLLGLSMTKQFRPTTSNIVGVDLSKYKVVDKHVFAFDTMSVIRTGKVPIAVNLTDDLIIVSPAYVTFKSKDDDLLDPLYLMIWFSRSQFDRFAFFKSDASVRGGYNWDELCDTLIDLPPIEEQREIVAQYEAITRRITLNERICANLEETAQALYNKMFVQGIDPDNLPDGWRMGTLDEIGEIVSGATPLTDNPLFWSDNDISWLTPADISSQGVKFISKGERDITIDGYNSCSTKEECCFLLVLPLD